MKRAFIFFAAVAMLLIEASPLWTQGEPQLLEVIWKREQSGLQYSTVCKPARLAICSKRTKPAPFPRTYYLIDLKTGEDIYQTDPNMESGLYVNYMGDKFYVFDIANEKWKEFDTKTKEYIQNAYGPLNTGFRFASPDNEFVEFDSERHILLFTDINTGIVKDSFQIAGSQQNPQRFIGHGLEFTPDGRYFNFTTYWLLDNNGPNTFHIYDRQTGEIIFKRVTPGSSNFRYQYFNTSNKIAFAEEVQLPGDDKVYSYLRVFDPDTRTIVKNIKISEYPNLSIVINSDDTKIIYQVSDPQQNNVKQIYNLKDEKFESLKFRAPVFLADTNALYSWTGLALIAYKFDWTVGVEDIISQEFNVIYPNPTNGFVSLNITPEFIMGEWNVSDMQGRILKKGLIGHASTLEINIAGLVPGTYYLTLTKNEKKSSYKLIKQ